MFLKRAIEVTKINREVTIGLKIKTCLYEIFIQPFKMAKNSKKSIRYLEIGPGDKRIDHFETMNTLLINETDYIGQLGYRLPFEDESFDIVYMSHVLEHIFWHKLEETIREVARIIKSGGAIEIWVPDGLKIAQAYVDAENGINDDYKKDGWYRFNPSQDPCVWFSGRVFAYGDGLTPNANNHYNVHLAVLNYRYLKKVLETNGFSSVIQMDNSECRGYDHGWINLGVKAYKR